MKKQMTPDTENGIEVREGKEIMDTLLNHSVDYNQEEQLQYAFNVASTRVRDALYEQMSTLVIIDKYLKVLANQTDEEDTRGLLSEISELSQAVSTSLKNLKRVMRNERDGMSMSDSNGSTRPRSAISAATERVAEEEES